MRTNMVSAALMFLVVAAAVAHCSGGCVDDGFGVECALQACGPGHPACPARNCECMGPKGEKRCVPIKPPAAEEEITSVEDDLEADCTLQACGPGHPACPARNCRCMGPKGKKRCVPIKPPAAEEEINSVEADLEADCTLQACGTGHPACPARNCRCMGPKGKKRCVPIKPPAAEEEITSVEDDLEADCKLQPCGPGHPACPTRKCVCMGPSGKKRCTPIKSEEEMILTVAME